MDQLTAAAKTSALCLEPLDDPVVADSTPSFTGMRSYGSADQLADAEFRLGINIDTKQGYAQTRRGSQILGALLPGPIQSIGFFSTPAFAWLIVVSNGTLYKFDGTSWSTWGDSYAAANGAVQVTIAQLVNLIYLADGTSNLMSYDGTTSTDLGNNTGSSSSAAPPVGSLVVSDTYRLWMAGITQAANGSSSGSVYPVNPGANLNGGLLYCSLLLDGAIWDANYLCLQVGYDDDPIVGLAPWINNQLVVFKRNSIYIVTADPATTSGGASAPLSNATIQLVSSQIGCASNRSIAVISTDVWFLSDIGITSIGLVIAQQQSEVKTPTSRPIQDLINRINWQYANASAGFFWNNRYMLSVPLDEDTSPTTILVYSTLQQGWSGYWTQMEPLCWALSKTNGLERLNFGRQDGAVYQWLDYVPLQNETYSTFMDNGLPVPSSVLTRAMIFSDPICPKSPFNLSAEFDESAAPADVAICLDEGSPIAVLSAAQTSAANLILPFILPQTLPANGIFRAPASLQQFPQCRSMQVQVSAQVGKISCRAVTATAFINSMQIE